MGRFFNEPARNELATGFPEGAKSDDPYRESEYRWKFSNPSLSQGDMRAPSPIATSDFEEIHRKARLLEEKRKSLTEKSKGGYKKRARKGRNSMHSSKVCRKSWRNKESKPF